MIDPCNVTKFDRTRAELEEFYLFCVVVAGKNARIQAGKLDAFLNALSNGISPFDKLRYGFASPMRAGNLEETLRRHRLGQYERLMWCFQRSTRLDLATCTVADLEATPGVGPKTARFFLLHTRPNQRYAALDTHILKHLAANGVIVPKTTPSGRRYKELEAKFLELADQSGMSPANYDLVVWKRYAGRTP